EVEDDETRPHRRRRRTSTKMTIAAAEETAMTTCPPSYLSRSLDFFSRCASFCVSVADKGLACAGAGVTKAEGAVSWQATAGTTVPPRATRQSMIILSVFITLMF